MKNFINKVIQILILNNFFLNSGWGLLSPIYTVFIVKYITGGDLAKAVEVVGLSTLVYWVLKSILQIPIANLIDKIKGEGDDFWFLFWGTLITAFVPLGFIFSTHIWHIYALQIIYAVGSAMNFPSWSALFTNHIDEGKEALEWSVNSTFLGVGFGVANGIGGLVIALTGFNVMFILVGLFLSASAFILLFIREDVLLKTKRGRAILRARKKVVIAEIVAEK
ncbi:MFS transporter [Candidatus Parcubacteria bacterium]|nr:MFS transporter [Candidatus Parcubacteria bacterium]